MSENPTEKARNVRPRKKRSEPEISVEGLANEIAMLRSLMQRVADLVDDGCQLGELLEVLETVGKAQTRLVTLLKAQQSLGGEAGFAALLNRALDEVNQGLFAEHQSRRQR